MCGSSQDQRSGNTVLHPALFKMLWAASHNKIDVVLVRSLSRIGYRRTQIRAVYAFLRHFGVVLETTATDLQYELHRIGI